MSTSFLPVPQFNSFCSFLNFLCLFHGSLISVKPVSYFIHKKRKEKWWWGGEEKEETEEKTRKGKRRDKKKKQLISSASITTTLPANLPSCQHQDPSLPLYVMTTDKRACLAMPIYSWAVLIGPLQVSLSALVLLGQSITTQTWVGFPTATAWIPCHFYTTMLHNVVSFCSLHFLPWTSFCQASEEWVNHWWRLRCPI